MSETTASTRQLIINDSPVKNRQGLASDVGIHLLAANTAPVFAIMGDGKVTTNVGGSNNSVTVQADGKILLGGSAGSGFALVRYNTDGSLDTSFDGDGIVTTAVGRGAGDSVTMQADGKILLGGTIYNGSSSKGTSDFALVRYNTDGSLDSSFNGDGIVTTDFGRDESGKSVAMQADGKILLGGYINNGSNEYFALVRYNTNGSLDMSFDGDGKVSTEVGNNSVGYSVTVQADGKILLGGSRFTLVRYNVDGSLDTSFDGDGIVTTAFGSSSDSYSVTLQADGKILLGGLILGGTSSHGSSFDFALVRYNTDGSLDTNFDGDGIVTTDFGGDERGNSVTVQADGKILLGGFSANAKSSNWNFDLVRYNTDGSLDTSFDGDGKVTTDLGGQDFGQSVVVQTDGKILLGGVSQKDGRYDFAVVRYNTDGSLDNTFDVVNTLNGKPTYTENRAAIVLDKSVQIYDAELADQDSYNGASITLARHGGANNQDVFSGSGNLSLSVSNAQLLSGITIGTVSNHNGTLTIHFNGNATQARVNEVLSSLAYSNTSDNPPTSVQIDWTFNDGNTGKQGTGGALKALGSTTVNITPINDAPTFKTPSAINLIDSVFDDSFTTVKGKLVANDAESSSLTYGITGGTDNGNGTISKSSLYGVLTITKLTGAYSFVANDAAIEPLKANAGVGFTVTASDGVLRGSVMLEINIAQKGATESIGNDKLNGNSGNNKFDGLAGNDSINGLAGADTMKGGLGNDFYVVDNKGDVVIETSALATEMDTVNSSVTYTIKNYVENLALTGTAAINGTGNALNNILTGNAGANTLAGLAGNDVITGLAGADTMIGGLGNDIYVVDNIGDVVTEYSALVSEIDSVNSSVSYTLKANVEKLTLTGTAAINGTGNALNNVLTGNTGANILNGLAGNDIIDGLTGADTMAGGMGNDVYFVDNKSDVVIESSTLATEIDKVNSAVSYTLSANVENLVLTGTAAINGTGNALDNVITGNAAANTLNGGIGADMLIGGSGNDVYVVDNGADIVSETSAVASEIDRVDSSVSYTLKANVENLTLAGTAAINGTGNTLANVITGNAGNNLLVGYEGSDTLNGGSGNDILNGVTGQDVLTGGAGFDAFRFSVVSTPGNADVITDFVVADDSIQLENAVFTQFITTGTLDATHFVKADVALDLDDYVIYNPASGALMYDADGNNTGAAVLIAVLGTNLALTNGDIVVI